MLYSLLHPIQTQDIDIINTRKGISTSLSNQALCPRGSNIVAAFASHRDLWRVNGPKVSIDYSIPSAPPSVSLKEPVIVSRIIEDIQPKTQLDPVYGKTKQQQ